MVESTHANVVLDGRLLPRREASIGIDDGGFLVGEGLFETLRIYDGYAFLLDEHLDRLFRGADQLELPMRYTPAELREWVWELVRANQARQARLRITVTAGVPKSAAKTTILVTTQPYRSEPQWYEGVVVTFDRERRHPSVLHGLKSTSYLPRLLQRRAAGTSGAFDVLQWNTDGFLTEGSFTNVFVVDASGTLRTPSLEEGCLPGITRASVLRLASDLGKPYIEGRIGHDDLMRARECFLTSSLIELVPVARVEERLWDAVPGPVTRELSESYRREIHRQANDSSNRKGN